MYLDPWLPLKYTLLPEVQSGPLLHAGESFQILRTNGLVQQALLVAPEIAQSWVEAGLLDADQCDELKFGSQEWRILTSDERHLLPLNAPFRPNNYSVALGFAQALKRTRAKLPEIGLAASIYCERLAVLLPVPELSTKMSDDVVLGRFLTGGVEVSCFARTRMASLAPWIPAEELREICAAAGLSETQGDSVEDAPSTFSLAGRHELEAFLREHVIDIVQNFERYRSLGIDFPSAIVLHGPPGSGKTFAVDALVAFLKWPCLHIDSASIGSPYIHATGQKIADVFAQAMQHAPSVVVIDEMEGFLGDRHDGGPHRVEEVAEFLRCIPKAQENRVLVIGMTNRLEKIDKAILRRGRFDHLIKVDLPTEKEVADLLNSLLAERPCEETLSLNGAIRFLTGKPLSDVYYFVREAARRTARAGKEKIDDFSLAQALKAISQGE